MAPFYALLRTFMLDLGSLLGSQKIMDPENTKCFSQRVLSDVKNPENVVFQDGRYPPRMTTFTQFYGILGQNADPPRGKLTSKVSKRQNGTLVRQVPRGEGQF